MLFNKTALITGGARGIGLTIAKELTTQRVKVVICSRTKTDLNNALKILNQKKRVAHGIICDVSKLSSCQRLIKFTRSKLKRIDILVNNAGVYGPIGSLEDINTREFLRTIEINLMGMVYCSNLVIPLMKKQGGGKIINMCGAGVGGSKTMPRFAAYFTSKFAIAGFSEVLAAELQEKNIQVNSISPGAVNTYLNEYLIKQGPKITGNEIYEAAIRRQTEGGTAPELTAKLIAYLCSSKSNHISGRLLSSKWNPPEQLKKIKRFGNNLFKLRRIDQDLYYENK